MDNEINVSNKKAGIQRIKWLDVARTIAIICVVLCHSTESIYNLNPEFMNSLNIRTQIYGYVFFVIGRLGVPLFLFITGALLLNRYYNQDKCIIFWKRKLLPLIIVSEIWVIIYSIFICIFNNTPLRIDELLSNMLFLTYIDIKSYWYLPLIISLYVIIPFLANIVNTFNLKIVFIPYCISIIILSINVINIFLLAFGEKPLNFVVTDSFCGGIYGLMLILGYYVYKNKCNMSSRNLIIIFLIMFSVTVFTQYYVISVSFNYTIWYDFIPLILSSLALFMMVKNVKSFPFYFIFNNISLNSFGIYLVHVPIQKIFDKFFILNFNLPIQVILHFTITFCISWLLVIILNKIPKIGKILFLK